MLIALLFVTKVRVYYLMWGTLLFWCFGPLSSGICARAIIFCNMMCAVDLSYHRQDVLSWSAVACVCVIEIISNEPSKSINFDISKSIETALVLIYQA